VGDLVIDLVSEGWQTRPAFEPRRQANRRTNPTRPPDDPINDQMTNGRMTKFKET
jgi:hypothetical protein